MFYEGVLRNACREIESNYVWSKRGSSSSVYMHVRYDWWWYTKFSSTNYIYTILSNPMISYASQTCYIQSIRKKKHLHIYMYTCAILLLQTIFYLPSYVRDFQIQKLLATTSITFRQYRNFAHQIEHTTHFVLIEQSLFSMIFNAHGTFADISCTLHINT